MTEFKPFFFNSNLCTSKIDYNNPDSYFDAIAGNIGNSYITFSLIKETLGSAKKINHIQNIYTFDYSKSNEIADFVNSECSHFILILQDQIRVAESYNYRLPYDSIIALLKMIKKPVLIAGLGANCLEGFIPNYHKQLNYGLILFLKELAEIVPTIGIRGHYTEELMHNIGIKNVRVIGCPSFFEMGKNKRVTKKDKISKVCFSSVIDNVNYKSSHTILQDEKVLINQLCFNYSKRLEATEYYKFKNGLFHAFASIWEWKKFIAEFDMVFGYRVHGGILATNCNVVPIVTNKDSRAREMCELLNIPYMPDASTKKNMQKIYDRADVDKMNAKYPVLYENYRSFLQEYGINLIEDFILDKNVIKQPSLKNNIAPNTRPPMKSLIYKFKNKIGRYRFP